MTLILTVFTLLTMTQIAEDPKACAEGTVEISGFAYQSEKGAWVLSAEPNLQSCCAGAKGKREKQVALHGEMKELLPSSIVRVRGILKRESEGLVLEHPVVVEQTPTGFWQSLWK